MSTGETKELETKKVDWLTKAGVAVGVRIQWEQTEGVRTKRLDAVKSSIDSISDEIKSLSSYEIDVKGFLFDKKIKSHSDKDTWDPDNEVDTGRDVKRMKKAIPPEVADRLRAAQDKITALQESLQNSIPKEQHGDIRAAYTKALEEAKKKAGDKPLDMQAARKEIQDKLAEQFDCAPNEISKIELEGALPDNEEGWKEIKTKTAEMKAEFDKAQATGKQLEKDLKAANGKPEKTQKELKKKVDDQKLLIAQVKKEVDQTRADLAKRYKLTEEQVTDIAGWTPVFSDLEIRKELWKPLMRSGVIADNTIPDAFNETVQQFQGANKLYQARLEKENASDTDQNLDTAKKFLKHLTDMTSAVSDAVGAPDLVGTITDAIDGMGQAMLSGTKAILKKDCEGVLDAIGDMLESSLNTALGKDSDLGGLITGAYRATVKGAVSLEKLAENPKENWKDFLSGIGEAIETSFGLCGTDDDSKAKFALIGGLIKDAFDAIDASADVAKACLSDEGPDPDKLVEALTKFATIAFKRGMSQAVSQAKDVTTYDTDKGGLKRGAPDDDKVKSMGDNLDDVADSDLSGIFDALKSNPTLMAKAKEALKKQEEKGTDEQIENEMEDFKSQLALSFAVGGNDPEALKLAQESNSIDKLIDQVNADKAMLKMAESVFDTGIKTAAEFFEPLKIVSSGKDFVKQLILAVRRALELKEWITLREDALNAASVQGFAFANRIKNLSIQVSQHTMDAVLELAQLVGAAASCSGIGSGAGVALSKAAKVTQTIKDFIFDAYQEADLRKQWNKYLACLANPYDRAQMRSVIAGNPTLSKYAMAYAAVSEDDAIAKQGMQSCGINEATLKNPGTNADKVVTFLETKFDEDPQLIRQAKKAPWQTNPTDLSSKNWMANKKAAEKKLKLQKSGSGGIDAALDATDVAKDDFDDLIGDLGRAKDTFDKKSDTYRAAYISYTGALGVFNTGVQMYEAAKKNAETAQQAFTTKKPGERDEKFVAEQMLAVEKFITAAETLDKRVKDYQAKTTPFEKQIDPYLTITKEFLDAIRDRSKMETYRSALSELDKQLKKYKPMSKEDKDPAPKLSKEMQEYLTALSSQVTSTLRTAGSEQDRFKASEDEATTQQKEAEAHQEELKADKAGKIAGRLTKEVSPLKKALEEMKKAAPKPTTKPKEKATTK